MDLFRPIGSDGHGHFQRIEELNDTSPQQIDGYPNGRASDPATRTGMYRESRTSSVVLNLNMWISETQLPK